MYGDVLTPLWSARETRTSRPCGSLSRPRGSGKPLSGVEVAERLEQLPAAALVRGVLGRVGVAAVNRVGVADAAVGAVGHDLSAARLVAGDLLGGGLGSRLRRVQGGRARRAFGLVLPLAIGPLGHMAAVGITHGYGSFRSGRGHSRRESSRLARAVWLLGEELFAGQGRLGRPGVVDEPVDRFQREMQLGGEGVVVVGAEGELGRP